MSVETIGQHEIITFSSSVYSAMCAAVYTETRRYVYYYSSPLLYHMRHHQRAHVSHGETIHIQYVGGRLQTVSGSRSTS